MCSQKLEIKSFEVKGFQPCSPLLIVREEFLHARTSLLNFGTLVRKVPQFSSRQLVHHAREQIFRGRVQDAQTCRAKAPWSECVVPQVLHHASLRRPASDCV